MEYAGCKEAAFNVVKEATEKFSEFYYLEKERYGDLDEICNLVDEVVQIFDDEFGCKDVTVEVNTATKKLVFSIVCDQIILQHGRTHKFYDLVGLVDSIRFSKAEPDDLRIEVGVHGLWERKNFYE